MKPALLSNENFPMPAVLALRNLGFRVLSVQEEMAGADDQTVLARATSDGLWLLTFDSDYGELVFARKMPAPPAVILCRERHYRPAEPAQWLLPLLTEPGEYDGMFCVVTKDSVRKRPLLRAVGS